MKPIEGDIEEMAEESAQDRRDHADLMQRLKKLLADPDVMQVPIAVRRLIDGGIDPVVVAKTLLVGSRVGSKIYELSARSPELGQHERSAETYISIAVRDIQPDDAAAMLVVGAVWLATQCKISRPMLVDLVRGAVRREPKADRVGYGAVDFVDQLHVLDRAWLVRVINEDAQLPMFAPLEYKPG
jgi:hypothetical protein